MTGGWVRIAVLVVTLAMLGFTGNHIRRSELALDDEQNVERVFTDLSWSLTLTLGDLRAALQAYVAAGQDHPYWTAKASSHLDTVRSGLDNLRRLRQQPDLDRGARRGGCHGRGSGEPGPACPRARWPGTAAPGIGPHLHQWSRAGRPRCRERRACARHRTHHPERDHPHDAVLTGDLGPHRWWHEPPGGAATHPDTTQEPRSGPVRVARSGGHRGAPRSRSPLVHGRRREPGHVRGRRTRHHCNAGGSGSEPGPGPPGRRRPLYRPGQAEGHE